MDLAKLIATLNYLNGEEEVTAQEVADILWLARYIKLSAAPASEVINLPLDSVNKTSVTKTIRQSESKNSKPETESVPPSAQTGAHLMDGEDNQGRLKGGMPFSSPTGAALPGSLEVARSLRPLKRHVPSRTQFLLDEKATVQRIAEENLWVPILKPAPERWLDVSLVLDEGSSMAIWQQSFIELRRLLERQGAFRHIRSWGLDTSNREKVKLYSEAAIGRSRNPEQGSTNPGELVDHKGRRLIMLMTDCTSPAWYGKKFLETLQIWGKHNSLVVVQVLPQYLWRRTALGIATAGRLQLPSSGASNQHLRLLESSDPFAEEEALVGLPIPVVTLEPPILNAWTKILGEARNGWTPVFVLNETWSRQRRPPTNFEKFEPEELINRFWATASPQAQKLAVHLSATPISLPVVRLIQRTLLPQSRQVHVAELFLSGILKLTKPHSNPDYAQYDFINDRVRGLLLNALPFSKSRAIMAEVSQEVASRSGLPMDFKALLLDPDADAVDGLYIPEDSLPFISVAATVLHRWGGEYSKLATRLENRTNQGVLGSLPLPPLEEDWAATPSIEHQTPLEEKTATNPSKTPLGVNTATTPSIEYQTPLEEDWAATPSIEHQTPLKVATVKTEDLTKSANQELPLPQLYLQQLEGLIAEAQEIITSFKQELPIKEGLIAEAQESITRLDQELLADKSPTKKSRSDTKKQQKIMRDKKQQLAREIEAIRDKIEVMSKELERLQVKLEVMSKEPEKIEAELADLDSRVTEMHLGDFMGLFRPNSNGIAYVTGKRLVDFKDKAIQVAERYWLDRGEDYINQAYFNETFACYKRAEDLAHQRGDKWDAAKWLTTQAICYVQKGEFEVGLEKLQTAVKQVHATRNSPTEAICLTEIGICHAARGEFEEAVNHFKKSLKVNRLVPRPIMDQRDIISYQLSYLAMGLLDQGNYSEALSNAQESVQLAGKIGDDKCSSLAYYMLGCTHLYLNNLEEAFQAAREGTRFEDLTNKFNVLTLLGIIELRRQSLQSAREAFTEAIAEIDQHLADKAILYDALYKKSLDLYGLALLEAEPDGLIQEAILTYDEAYKVNNAPGLIHRCKRLYQKLIACPIYLEKVKDSPLRGLF